MLGFSESSTAAPTVDATLSTTGGCLATKILIVDDSALVRQRVRYLLEEEAGWEICEARDGPEALNLAQTFAPHLIVLDFLMPGMDGLQAASELRKIAPEIRILMFSMHLSPRLVELARGFGVMGAVAKSDSTRLREACHSVLNHQQYFYHSTSADRTRDLHPRDIASHTD